MGVEANKSVRGKNALTAKSEVAAQDVSANDFHAVVVPGGWAPDKLRRYPAVTNIVRDACTHKRKSSVSFATAGLVGISANIVRGYRATGSLGIKDDLINAGRDLGGRTRLSRTVISSGDALSKTFPRLLRVVKAIEQG